MHRDICTLSVVRIRDGDGEAARAWAADVAMWMEDGETARERERALRRQVDK
jgi:hypothetical protein